MWTNFKLLFLFLFIQLNLFAQLTMSEMNEFNSMTSHVPLINKAIDSTKVLFIGNSITYFNDMPFLFRNIANNKGKNVSVTMYAPGGTGIVNHYQDPNVYSLIDNGNWDYIILQPGSGESAGASWPVDTTIYRTRILLDSIYSRNECTKVFLYEIPYGVPSSTEYATYFSVQTMFRDSITKMSDSLNIPLVPAGECARAHYSVAQDLMLHNSYNDIHPSIYGSYLVAASFYTSIFRDSVQGCSFYSSIGSSLAQEFHEIADSIVLNYLNDWNQLDFYTFSDFDYLFSGSDVQFNNQSSNYESVFWDFGDGTSSTIDNPIHTYSANGTYDVLLSIFKGGCVDTLRKEISVDYLAINETTIEQEINVYPNPVFEKIYLSNLQGDFQVYIRDQNGKVVTKIHCDKSSLDIDVANFPCGKYYIELTNKTGIFWKDSFVKY